MSKVPALCPCCYSSKWVPAADNITKSGFSVGKAALGGFLLGPIGLVAGGLGKKHRYVTYVCQDCHFFGNIRSVMRIDK